MLPEEEDRGGGAVEVTITKAVGSDKIILKIEIVEYN